MEEKRVLAVVERSGNGYGAYVEGIDGVAVTGSDIREVEEALLQALKMHVEGLKEDGDPVPSILDGAYTVDYRMDIESFFKWMGGIIQQTGLAKRAGLNRSLLAQYANGLKKPSPAQSRRLEAELHRIGADLLAIRL